MVYAPIRRNKMRRLTWVDVIHCVLTWEINLDSCFAGNCWFPADVVDPDWAQQIVSFYPRMYSLLRPNMDINSNGHFAENCRFPGNGVGTDWAQQVAAFYMSMHCFLRPNMEINLHGYFAENCWFPGDGVDPD